MIKTDLKQVSKTDVWLWLIYAGLILASVVVSFSSNSQYAYKRASFYAPWVKHLAMLGGGFILIFLLQHINIKWLKILSLPLLLVNLVLQALCYVPGIGSRNVHSVVRTIDIPGVSFDFQPDEYLKFTLIIFLATLLYMILKTQSEQKRKILNYTYIGTTLVSILLVFKAHNSTAIIMTVMSYVLYLISGVDVKKTLKFGAIMLLAAVCAFMLLWFLRVKAGVSLPGNLNTLVSRVVDYFTVQPDEIKYDLYAKDNNAQIKYSKIAIAGGSHGLIIGRGPGKSVERDKLPVANADYVFAIIVEEYGWFGILITLMLFMLLLSRVGNMVKKSDDDFASLVAIGCGLTIGLQALISILVVVDLIPSTGQPLPFISVGGNSALSISAAVGVIMAASKSINSQLIGNGQDDEQNEPTIIFEDDAEDEKTVEQNIEITEQTETTE